MKVKFTDNSKKVLEEFNKKIYGALKAVGMQAASYAREDCPVDTSRLKNSIGNEVKENTAYIGTNVKYAPYIEYGDKIKHTNGKAHFLRDAATKHNDEYKNIVLEHLKS